MNNIKEQVGKLMGESLARGKDRWLTREAELLVLQFQLLALELDLFLAGGPIPKENKQCTR